MDNATIHHGEVVEEIMQNRGFEWHYLPPYSPFFNPIENMFAIWKHYVRQGKCKTEEELFDAIHKSARKSLGDHCNNMITHISS